MAMSHTGKRGGGWTSTATATIPAATKPATTAATPVIVATTAATPSVVGPTRALARLRTFLLRLLRSIYRRLAERFEQRSIGRVGRGESGGLGLGFGRCNTGLAPGKDLT
jgi:outer membrane receptor protein involved in Fe transport